MGSMAVKFELRQDIYTMHLPTQFHNPMFNYSLIIMLTNEQTNKQAD